MPHPAEPLRAGPPAPCSRCRFIHVAHEMLRWGSCRSQAQYSFYGPMIGRATHGVAAPVCTNKNPRVLTRSNMTNDIAVLQDEIRAMSDDPAGLEDLYRKAQAEGSEAAFREALRQCEEKDPNNVLLHAWVHRLGLELERGVAGQTRKRHWGVIIAASIVLGVFSALLANGEPP